MKFGIRLFVFLALFSIIGWSQNRLFDKVVVDFPQTVHINDQVVPAGHYEFRQLRDTAGGSQIVGLTTEGGAHFETAAIPVPALNNNTPDATRVILQKVGSDYYLDKIWISGKDYGYQFTIPDDVKSRLVGRAEPITLSLRFQSSVRPPQENPVASAPARPPEPAPAPAPSARPAEPPPPPQQLAQAAPPPAPEPAPRAATPAPAPAPQTESTPPPEQPKRLPSTASNWPITLAVGVAALTAAVFVRRLA
jgi:hypothetical protein